MQLQKDYEDELTMSKFETKKNRGTIVRSFRENQGEEDGEKNVGKSN